jgi:hypothetical protein
MAEGFTGAIAFMDKIGVYDVVLPFLLVFTLIYAFLEKTKVFGTDTYYLDEGHTKSFTGSRRNLNAMVSFTVAFFVVASSQLVSVINQTMSHMVLLLVLVFCFILVAGAFQKQTDDGFFLEKPWKGIFMVIVFVAMLFIFLNALGWLEPVYKFILRSGSSEGIATIILLALIAGFVALIAKDPNKKASVAKSED